MKGVTVFYQNSIHKQIPLSVMFCVLTLGISQALNSFAGDS